MAKSRRGTRQRGAGETQKASEGSGSVLGQVGLFETANGMPHGPVAIALAIVAAILILPMTRFVRYLTRR